MQTVISSVVILIGAAVMLVSVIKSGDLLKIAPLISERRRGSVIRLLRMHRALMSFFLVGYVVVALAFWLELRLVGELFVSAVFFFGAAFVLMGIIAQSRMLLELQSTIRGILPICSRCHKVRSPEKEPNDRESWMAMETYLQENTDADVSRGFCPECMDKLYGLPEDMRS